MNDNYYNVQQLAKYKIDDQQRLAEHLADVAKAKATKKQANKANSQSANYNGLSRKRGLLSFLGR